MKTAICFFSSHHGNTLRVAEAMAEGNDVELIDGRARAAVPSLRVREGGGVELIDVRARAAVSLEQYDAVGFASGIYFGKFHKTVIDFLRQYLPEGKPVFFVSTCGSPPSDRYTAAISAAAAEKNARVLGSFSCRGYDTYGPFKLVGGIAKGHPDERDLSDAREFYNSLADAHERAKE